MDRPNQPPPIAIDTMANRATKLVILAAGMGTRMRRDLSVPGLSQEQKAVAESGIKALIPVGRPFLDYVLHRAAEAGLTQVCLVVGPRHEELRQYYANVARQRLRIEFAVQQQPLGTADAVAAAKSFVKHDPFLVLNSDNCYPTRDLHCLRNLAGPAVVGFERDTLTANSNLVAERLARFALIESNTQGFLRQIQEKPDPELIRNMAPPVLVGMNCWRFSPAIFESCRKINKSTRGEYEIPDAVLHSMRELGECYQVVSSPGPVFDLSSQSDIAAVQTHLQSEDVHL